ncbi:MAG: hypothetical protein MJY87_10650 [Fibrobacter sp.]|nr:hypothetical protein [Fibrobacter sp.]
MKMTRSLLAVSALALSSLFVACSDDSSSTGSGSSECSVTNGIVIVSPAAGDSYKAGETITVVFGTDIAKNGFRIQYRPNADAKGVDLTEESVGPEKPDGKTCYEVKVTLDEDLVTPSKDAVIRVIPYDDQAKGENSATFTVTE